MEIKKSNEANIEKKKPGIFLYSLVVATGFMLMAFEWANYEVAYTLEKEEMGELIEDAVVIQDIKIIRPQPKAQPKNQSPIVDDYEVKPIEEEEPKDVIILDTTSNDLLADVIDTTTIVFEGEDKGPELQTIFEFGVEKNPEYQGGLENMYKELNDYLKPNHIGISGKVYIEFVVEKDGSLSHVIIKKGVHETLDNNALQAVKKLNKWEPGIQNHHPVRVRMVLPINFKVR